MQHEAMLNELMELILSGDPVESDIHQLYAGLQPHLQALADWLHVARTDIRIEIQPNVYEIRGRTETFGNTYHDEIGGAPLVLAYPHLSHIVGTAMIYPWRGHAWNETELHRIKAISNLLVLEFSCANMTKRAKKTPYIDLLTGLSNNPGVAYYGARMEQQYDMSKYAGCFINLKYFKYINNQLGNAGGDEAMRQYAFRLYDFLQPTGELYGCEALVRWMKDGTLVPPLRICSHRRVQRPGRRVGPLYARVGLPRPALLAGRRHRARLRVGQLLPARLLQRYAH